MKNYSKVGKKSGRPAYRTPSSFRYKQFIKLSKIKRSKTLPKKNNGFSKNYNREKGRIYKG